VIFWRLFSGAGPTSFKGAGPLSSIRVKRKNTPKIGITGNVKGRDKHLYPAQNVTKLRTTGSGFLNAELSPQLVKGVSNVTARGFHIWYHFSPVLALKTASVTLQSVDSIAEGLECVLHARVVQEGSGMVRLLVGITSGQKCSGG
jgi:hypothetical protein